MVLVYFGKYENIYIYFQPGQAKGGSINIYGFTLIYIIVSFDGLDIAMCGEGRPFWYIMASCLVLFPPICRHSVAKFPLWAGHSS